MRGILKKCGILSVMCVAAILGCGGDSSDSNDGGTPTVLEGTWEYKDVVDATEYYIYTYTFSGNSFTIKEETFDGSGTSLEWDKTEGTISIGSDVTIDGETVTQFIWKFTSRKNQDGEDTLDEFLKSIKSEDNTSKDIFKIDGNVVYFGKDEPGADGYPSGLDMTEKNAKK